MQVKTVTALLQKSYYAGPHALVRRCVLEPGAAQIIAADSSITVASRRKLRHMVAAPDAGVHGLVSETLQVAKFRPNAAENGLKELA